MISFIKSFYYKLLYYNIRVVEGTSIKTTNYVMSND
jgi:hypothetical protein